MGKHPDSWSHRKIADRRLLDSIFHSEHPIETIERILEPQKSELLELHDLDVIHTLRNFITQELTLSIQKLQQEVREGNSGQQFDRSILRILNILGKMFKNATYLKASDEDKEDFYHKILTWTQSSQVIQKLLKVVLDFSFREQCTPMYYFIKFFMTHLNSYGGGFTLKQLLNPIHSFQFTFHHQKLQQTKTARVDNLQELPEQARKNAYQSACYLNQTFHLQLSDDSEIFWALMVKIRLTLFEDRNSVVRSVTHAIQTFSHIQIVWLRSAEDLKIPNIFSLPPRYGLFFKQMFQLLFQNESNQKTSVCVLETIHDTLVLEDQQAQRIYVSKQLLTSIAQTSSALIYVIISDVFRVVQKQKSIKLPQKVAENFQVLKMILKIMSDRVAEAKQLFLPAQSICQKIFASEIAFDDEEIIEYAGKILIGFDIKEEEMMELIIKAIEKKPEKSAPYLRIINHFFGARFTRQRRDFGLIARMIAESKIFVHLAPKIDEEVIEQKITSKSVTIETIKVISNTCSQTPVIVNQIEEQGQIITKLLKIIERPNLLPAQVDDLSFIVTFIHHIALKQGPIRDFAIGQPLKEFTTGIFSEDKLISTMMNKGSLHIFSKINRLHSNIIESIDAVIWGTFDALEKIIKQYQDLQPVAEQLITLAQQKQIEYIERLGRIDQKTANLLRTLEKTKDVMLPCMSKPILLGIISNLLILSFRLSHSLNDMQFEDRLIVSLIAEIETSRVLEETSQLPSQRMVTENQQNSRDLFQINLPSNEPKQEGANQKQAKINESLKNTKHRRKEQVFHSIRQLKQIISSDIRQIVEEFYKYENKEIKIPRKFVDLVFSNQYNQQNAFQIYLVHAIPKLQRFLHKMLRDFHLSHIEKRIDIFFNSQKLYEVCHKIVTLINGEVVSKNIHKLQNIESESIIQNSFAIEKQIVQSLYSKEIHGKLVQHFTPVQYFVDMFIKFASKCCSQFPIDSDYHQKFHRLIIAPLLEEGRKFIQKIKEKTLKELQIQEVDHVRFIVRFLIEMFCISDGESKHRPTSSISIITYHAYYLPENGYSVIHLISDVLRLFTPLALQGKDFYSLSLQERVQCAKTTIIKIAISRAKSFLDQAGLTAVLIQQDPVYTNRKLQPKTLSKALYVNLILQNQILDMMINMKLDEKRALPINAIIINNLMMQSSNFVLKSQLNQKSMYWRMSDLPDLPQNQQLTVIQFKRKFNQKTQVFYEWLMQNLHYQIPSVHAIWFTLLTRMSQSWGQEQTRQLNHPQKQAIKRVHDQISTKIVEVTQQLFPEMKLDLGVKRPLIKEPFEYEKVNIAHNMRRLCNLFTFVFSQINFYQDFEVHARGNHIISSNYITTIIHLAETLMDNYSDVIQHGEDITCEANDLAMIIINLLDVFVPYRTKVQSHFKAKKKTDKKNKKKKKRQLKKLKLQRQNQLKRSKSSQKSPQKQPKTTKTIISQQKKAPKRSHQTELDAKQGSPIKLIQSPRKLPISFEKLNLNRQVSQKSAKNKKKIKPKAKSVMNLNEQGTSYIRTVLESSEKYPFLKHRTMQAILRMVNFTLKQKSEEQKTTEQLQISGDQLIKPLLRAKLNDITNKGVFYQFCEFALHYSYGSTFRINSELAVKRFFFEKLPSKRVPLKQWRQFAKRAYSITPSHIMPFMTLICEETKTQQVDGVKTQVKEQNLLEATQANLINTRHNENVFVQLKEGVQFHTINYDGTDKKRKPSQLQETEQIKLVIDYIPEGHIQVILNELMVGVVRIFIKEAHRQYQKSHPHQKQMDEEVKTDKPIIEAFNVNSMLRIIQVLIRKNPVYIPYVVRFNCNQATTEELDRLSCEKNNCEFSTVLFGKKTPKQFHFLEFLCRFGSVLSINVVSSLILEFCYDNVPLHTYQNGAPRTVASITRVKVLSEITKSLSGQRSLMVKLTTLNLLTELLLIKQFAQLCVQTGLIQLLRKLYIKFSEHSHIYKHLLFAYFIKPLELLQELSYALQAQKKNKQLPSVHIVECLNKESIIAQLVSKNLFEKDRFMITWPHTGLNDAELEQNDIDESDQLDSSSSEGSDQGLSMIDEGSLIDPMDPEAMIPPEQSRNSWLRDEDDDSELGYQDNQIQVQFRQNLPNIQGLDFSQSLPEGDQDQEGIDEQHAEQYSQLPQQLEDIIDEELDEDDQEGSPMFSEDDSLLQDSEGFSEDRPPIVGERDTYDQFEDIIRPLNKVLSPGIPIISYSEIQIKNIQVAFRIYDEKNVGKVHNKLVSIEYKAFSEFLENDKLFLICKGVYFDQFYKTDHESINTFSGPYFTPITLNLYEEDTLQKMTGFQSSLQDRRMNRRPGFIIPGTHNRGAAEFQINLERMGSGRQNEWRAIINNPHQHRHLMHAFLPIRIQNHHHESQENAEGQQQDSSNPDNLDEAQFERMGNQHNLVGNIHERIHSLMHPHHRIDFRQIGMTEEEFRNLPRDAQQDILANLIMNPIQNPYGAHQPENRQQQRRQPERSAELEPEQNQRINEQPRQQNNELPLVVEEKDKQPSADINQKYQRIASHYQKHVLKDPIETAIKLSKNTLKPHRVSDEFLECIMSLLYDLNENQHMYFPYKIIETICIQQHSCMKILSTFLALLKLGPNIDQSDGRFEGIIFPRTKFMGMADEVISSYSTQGYKLLCLKILHMLELLSDHQTFSAAMLEPTVQPINSKVLTLEKTTFIEGFISLIEYPQIKDSEELLFFWIDCLSNITNHSYCKNIHLYLQKKKEQNKKDKELDVQINLDAIFEDDKTIEISQKAVTLLCSLLLSDATKETLFSQIITRLCLNKNNLMLFMSNFKAIAWKLAETECQILQKIKSNPNAYSEQGLLEQNKISSLLTIFCGIQAEIRSRKDFRIYQNEQFFQIISCKPIQKMCEAAIDLIELSNKNPNISRKVNEVMDCFFIIFKTAMDSKAEPDMRKKESTVNIASLGRISLGKEAIIPQENKIRPKIAIQDFNLEELWDKKVCTTAGKVFINASLRRKISSALKMVRSSKQPLTDIPILSIAMKTPNMLEFDNKKALFKVEIKRLKNKKRFGVIDIHVKRDRAFEHSFHEIMGKTTQQLKGRLRIEFEDEQGEDAGGVTREWFQILSKQMFNPNYALFKPSSVGTTYQPSPLSYVNKEHLKFFKFIGRVMGKALHDGFLLEAYFTPAFYKHILSLPIIYEDMEEEDFEYYNSLKWILENSPIQDYLDLNFTYQFDNFGELKVRELIPGGKDVKVTEANKLQYIELVSYAKMALSVKSQIESLLQGFHQLIPKYLIRIFDAKELQIMISGLPTIDIADLKNNTELVNYRKDDNTIVWLFQVLDQFNMDLRTSFLQFVTGTSRVPPDGFKSLRGFNGPQKFSVHRSFQITKLPRAHTCFNQLDLPNYPTKQILIQKLTLAITECRVGFGFT